MIKILKALKAAKSDDKIKGVFLEADFPLMGYSTAGILRNAIKDFRSSGKFVYSYNDNLTPKTYYLSCVADSMFLNPNGMVSMTGFASSSPFLKEFSDNVGIKWNVFYAGQFKSATEPLRLNKMSEQNKLQLHEFYDGLYNITRDSMLASRDINKDSLEYFVNNSLGFMPKNAIKYGIVDKLLHRIDFYDVLKKKSGIAEDKKLNLVALNKYIKTVNLSDKGDSKNKIAVIYMQGNIVDRDNGQVSIYPAKYEKAFNDIIRKDNIKGVVLRVNSPGGSGGASDEILRAIDKIKEAGKPVIVSMGDYAASGGYYISCHADTIVADANTLTGSIGVFAVIPDMKELWSDKLKIHFDSVRTHKMGLSISTEFGIDEDGKKLLQDYIDNFYETFLGVVAKGRNMTRDQVHEVAQGRIWLGAKAKELGLVDVLGNLDDAVEICAKKANLKNYKLSVYPRVKKNFMDEIVLEIANQSKVESILSKSRYATKFKPVFEVMNNEEMIGQPQARMLFEPELK